MDSRLTIPEIEKLVSEEAKQLDTTITPDLVSVYEDPFSFGDETLVVQIATRRPADRQEWTVRRLRFSQAIRDLLVLRGDERFPLLEVFEPEEWAGRNA